MCVVLVFEHMHAVWMEFGERDGARQMVGMDRFEQISCKFYVVCQWSAVEYCRNAICSVVEVGCIWMQWGWTNEFYCYSVSGTIRCIVLVAGVTNVDGGRFMFPNIHRHGEDNLTRQSFMDIGKWWMWQESDSRARVVCDMN